MEAHKIILIGGDHYNGLALVRMFGENGLIPYGIIVGQNSGKGFLSKSKYWKKTWCIESDDMILAILKDNFSKESLKPVIIAYSDGAASILDLNYNEISRHFILSSIHSNQGRIYEMMDKGKQVRFAASCGLRMAKSFEIALDMDYVDEDIPFPCIGKPIVSCEGDKKDIRKLTERKELDDYLLLLKDKGYERILLQEYLEIDKEYDIEGYVDGDHSTYFCNEKIRTWPNVGGPTAYAFSIDDERLNREVEKIVAILKAIHYSGLFDVEIFRVNGEYYFNEINWRNSAVCFAAKQSGINYPLYWFYSVIGQKYEVSLPRKYPVYAMNELLDFQHVKTREVPLWKWLYQLKHCEAKAYYDRNDPKPLRHRFKMFLRRRGF